MEVNIKELTRLLIENDILKFGEFTLKSGMKSWFYLDLRLIPSFPETYNYVINCYLKLLEKVEEFDALAGVAVAGIPFSSVLGYKLKVPSLIVRPSPKEHGLKKVVEGNIKPQSEVVLIDDLITTGSSKIPGILALRELGFKVENLVVLVDRSLGSLEELDEIQVKLISFCKIEEIFKCTLELEEHLVSKEKKEIILSNL
ncbi:MAG: orotate phosphoribosyltransferase [Candidatus Heimdallarchaeaceae archaeon]